MMMGTPSKQGAENNRGISGHMRTLHNRLNHALNLGLRSCGEKGRKWHSSDIEIQRLVLRSIDAFLDCISAETLQHPLVKESIGDMVRALEGILQLTNDATLGLASNVTAKIVNIVPSLILQRHVLDLVRPLTSLLASHQFQVSVSCATALKVILSKRSWRREGEAWEILKETNSVFHIVKNIKEYSDGTTPVEYVVTMVSLLIRILCRWRSSRFYVWSDAKLIEVLGVISLKPDFSVKVAVLQLYSAIALCGNGAQKLLENAETVLPMMVHCMDRSIPVSVRMEGFKLAQCLAMNEQECSKMMALCCEPIVKAIVNGMTSRTGLIPKDEMSLKMEACRLALFTRWPGEHHNYFWKSGVLRVLLILLLNNFHKTYQSRQSLSFEQKIAIVQEGLGENYLLDFRPFIWDILGGLAAHCLEDFDPTMHGDEFCVDFVIICACLAFVDSIRNARQLSQTDVSGIFMDESASRSVLMMIYSPSKHIASHTKKILSEVLKPKGKEYLNFLLGRLDQPRSKLGMPYTLQTVIYLMSLTSYSGLPQYRRQILKSQGINKFVAFIRWRLGNNVHIRRVSMTPHLHGTFIERTSCWAHTEDWDGNDIPLLFSLWGLNELMHHSIGQVGFNTTRLVSDLQGICSSDTFASGTRWYAASILSCFGFYGFPNNLGKRIGKAHNEKEFADMELVLKNGEALSSVHGVMLMVRCPSLLPPQELPRDERTFNGSVVRKDMEKRERPRKEVCLSARVDREALLKLLEYVYLGHLQAGEELVKKLKNLARLCNLQCLYQMLCKRSPKWGTPVPTFGLTFALEPAGHHFSDIILEAKATDLINWTCPTCSASVPHMHVHKVILWSSSDYFHSMFQSGMQESRSATIKVPVSWEALVKVVKWFYSDEMPKPISGCAWDNLDTEEMLHELYPYVELCWLAEYWLLGDDFHEHCTKVVISSLGSSTHLSIKILQIASDLCQNRLAEVAAKYMAPHYRQLRNSGLLDALDEELVDMVRTASVRFSQAGDKSHY